MSLNDALAKISLDCRAMSLPLQPLLVAVTTAVESD